MVTVVTGLKLSQLGSHGHCCDRVEVISATLSYLTRD